ncbi:MAG: hypothetical protein ACI837_002936 [Crocinitomicaceae bacterium]|jgi:hypothetical protein
MRSLFLLILMVTTFNAFGQERVVIDRSKKTEIIFDETNPNSFISVIKMNSDILGYCNLSGMDLAEYSMLSDWEREGLYRFEGSEMSDVPLIDAYGDNIILTNPDGTKSFAYPPNDSAFIDFTGISRIIFTLNDGDEPPFERLKEMELWKQFASGMYRVLAMDIADFMTLDGINIARMITTAQSDKIMGKDGPGLWSIMKDSCLNEMKSYQDRSEDGIFNENQGYAANYVLDHFPLSWKLWFSPDSPIKDNYSKESGYESYYIDFDYKRVQPYSRGLLDSVNYNLIDTNSLFNYFDAMHYIMTQDLTPLVDNYGEELLVVDESGTQQYVYEAPEEEYFFFEYEPVIIVVNQVKCAELEKCILEPVSLLFCLDRGNEKPELISEFAFFFDDKYVPRSYLKQYITDFKTEEVWQIPEFAQLKNSINNKKYRLSLPFEESSIPCQPCTNKKGLYALCWSGKALMPYIYDTLFFNKINLFEAYRGSERSYLDDKAKILFTGELETLYPIRGYPDVYLGQKGDNWTIFSKSGEYKMSWTYLPEGKTDFEIYDKSYAKLKDLQFVTKNEAGLKGLIDTRGNELIAHEYSELNVDDTYFYPEQGVGQLAVTAIGKIGSGDQWQVFDHEYRPKYLLTGTEFLKAHWSYLLFVKENHVVAYDVRSGEENSSLFKNDHHCISKESDLYGAVDANEQVLIPVKYSEIEPVESGEEIFLFCSNQEVGFDIYTKRGKLIGSYPEYQFASQTCSKVTDFYTIKNGDYSGIIYYNQKSKKFETLFNPEFRYLFCQSYEPNEPIATGQLESGENYFLFRDGHKVLKKD